MNDIIISSLNQTVRNSFQLFDGSDTISDGGAFDVPMSGTLSWTFDE
jgi:hypothetical protein